MSPMPHWRGIRFLITPHPKTLWDLKEERKRQKGLNNQGTPGLVKLGMLNSFSTKPQLLPEETAQRELFSLKHLFNIVP